MKLILHLLFGPIGRKLIVLMALVVAWGLWWVWPERPLRRVQFGGTAVPGNFHLIKDNHTAFVSTISLANDPAECGWRLIRLSDNKILASGPGDSIWGFSLTGDCVIFDDYGQLVKIDVATGRQQKRSASMVLPSSVTKGLQQEIRFCSDGSRFSILDHGLKVFETSSLKLIAHFPDVGSNFDLSFDGQLLIAEASEPKLFVLWNVDTQNRVGSFIDESVNLVRLIRLSPRGDLAYVLVPSQPPVEVAGDWLLKANVWDLGRSTKIGEFSCSPIPIFPRFSDDGRFLLVRRPYYRMEIVDLDANPPRTLSHDFWREMKFSDITSDGKFVLALNEDNYWLLWSIPDKKLVVEGVLSGEPVRSFGLAPDGQWWWSIQANSNQSQSKLKLCLEKLTGWSIAQSNGVVFRHSTTGRTMSFGEVFPVFWEASENKVWTQRQCNSATPGRRDTILEQWSLEVSHSIWLMWLLTAGGLAVIIIDVKQQASRGREAPVAA